MGRIAGWALVWAFLVAISGVAWAAGDSVAFNGGGAVYVVAAAHPRANDDNLGTAERPFRTIGKAASVVKAGDRVLIESGVYREKVRVEADGTAQRPIVFTAAPMARVVVTGAERITDWTREKGTDNVFSTHWPHKYLGWLKRRAHPDNDYHLMVGRAEQVHINNYPLLQVMAREKLSRGTFYVDLKAKRLYVWDRAESKCCQGPTQCRGLGATGDLGNEGRLCTRAWPAVSLCGECRAARGRGYVWRQRLARRLRGREHEQRGGRFSGGRETSCGDASLRTTAKAGLPPGRGTC